MATPPSSSAAAAAAAAAAEDAKSLREELTFPILLAERIRKAASEAETSRPECVDISRQVDRLSHLLCSTARLSESSSSFYDRPVRRIAADVSKNLERALALVRRCRHSGFILRHLFAITTSADFRKVSVLVESSIGDVSWLRNILDPNGGGGRDDGLNLTLPPFATNHNPTLAWVWSTIAALQMGRQLENRIDSAKHLASLASPLENERNRQMIVEEGAVPPLLKLLKESGCAEAQIAAAKALMKLVDNVTRTKKVSGEMGIPVIVQVLGSSPMKVQIAVAGLVARMAEVDPIAREEFGKENVMKPLVSCLRTDLVLDDYYSHIRNGSGERPTSIHSIVQINRERARKTVFGFHGSSSTGSTSSNSYYHQVQPNSSFSSQEGSSRGGGSVNRRERENESPEVKSELKTSCSLAIWRLCKKSLLNSKKIAEGKGLLCLSKIIETDNGEELQFNCLMAVMEIAEVAESNFDFRKCSWKPSLPPVKAVLNQLLRVIQEKSDPDIHIPAIKAIGSLARNFSAKDTRFIAPLVMELGSTNKNVVVEAAIALVKFVCPENHHRVEHSKTVIENSGVAPLLKLLKSACERAKFHGLVLLCHLCVNVGNSKVLQEARALYILEGALKSTGSGSLNPHVRELLSTAIHHLTLYQAGVRPHHPHGHTYGIV